MTWVVVPAAGRGSRMGEAVPKQYLPLAGAPLLDWTLRRLAACPSVTGLLVVLAPDDPRWFGWDTLAGRPVRTATGGAERADSVLAGLEALPATVGPDDPVLVHDAARPCVRIDDIERLLAIARDAPDGALLATPLADTLKRAGAGDPPTVADTPPRAGLWRALTPQAFPRALLQRALVEAAADGVAVTDESMAVERLGRHPRLVEGAADNIKVTTPADLALAAVLLGRD